MVLHDVRCPTCAYELEDVCFSTVPDTITCFDCGNAAEIIYRKRKRNAQWSDKDMCVVYRNEAGKIHYPGRNDQPTPKGFERVEIRSTAEMDRFEKRYNVTNERNHYDHHYSGFEREPGYDGRPVHKVHFED